MSSRSFYYLSTLLLCFHPVFRPHALVASDTPGTLQFYDDYDCEHPSTLNPTVTLQLSTCLVFTGAEGVVVDTVPPCPQGSSTAAPIYYSDTACGVQTSNVSPSTFSEGCFSLADGVNLYDAKSMMFSCQPAANNPHPSSTTTAVVSALAAVATGSTGSNGGGSASSSGSSSGSSTSSASGSSSTGTETQRNSTGSTGSSSQSTPGTSSTSGSGLSTSDIIALAVGLGIGISTIVLMILIWRFPREAKIIVSKVIPGWTPNQPRFPDSQSQQQLRNEPTQQRNYNNLYELPSQRTGPQQSPYNRPQEMDSQQQPFRAY